MPSGNPSPPNLSTDWLRRSGLFGTYLFAAFALLGITPATAGLVLCAVAFLIDFRDWRILGRDPLVLIALLFAVYVSIHSLATYLTAPVDALAAAAAETGADWIKILLFVPFAYWCGGRPERVRLLLFLALVGFTLGALRKIEWGQLDLSFFSTRFEVYLPAIAFGMFAGLGGLGLMALREHFWRPATGGPPRWLRVAAWLLLLVLMLEGLMLSYSRGSWIAFVLAAVLLVYLEWRCHATAGRAARRGAHIAAAFAVIIALGLVLVVQHEQISERLLWESSTFEKLLSGDLAAVPSTPSGLRVHALQFAAELWSQRPWLGWGAGSSRYLLAHSGRPELLMDPGVWLPHLHNTYAEILVQLGIVGFILVALLLWLLARGCVAACRSGQMPGGLCRFFAVSLLFVLIWNLMNYRLVRHDYTFFWVIFAGAAYSFRLRALLQGTQPPQAPDGQGAHS